MRKAVMLCQSAVLLAFVAGCVTATKEKAMPAPAAAKRAEKLVIRVNCGAGAEYTDKAGNKWRPSRSFDVNAQYGSIGGQTVARDPREIAGTDCPQVYLTELYGMTGYKFLVPNGKYTARLHFGETYRGITAAGQRLFDVTAQGKVVVADMDPFQAAGGAFKPVVKEARGIEVTNGELLIGFNQKVQSPEINGIEIISE